VLFVTGNDAVPDSSGFRAETGQQVLAKPFTLHDLRQAAEHTLSGP
jgi:hypothetical protein